MTEKNQTIWRQLNSYRKIIVGIAGGILAAAVLFGKIRDDIELIIELGKYVLPVTLIIVCLLVYFSQKTVGERFGKPKTTHKYSQNQRKVALIGLCLMSAALVLLGGLKISTIQANSKATTILVTQFNSSDRAALGTKDVILSNLESLENIYSDIRLIESGEIIKSSSSAQKLGKKRDADIVIWGWAIKADNSIHAKAVFEPIGVNKSIIYELQNPMQPVSLEEKQEFQINVEISADSGYLASSILGLSHYLSGKYETAILGFQEAIKQSKLASSNDYIDRGLIYTYLGNSYVATQQYEKAIDIYNESLKYDPSNLFLYLNIGRAYSLLGDYKKSLEIYNIAIDNFSTVSGDEPIPYCGCKAYAGRGLTNLAIGNVEESIADFKKALDFDNTYELAEHGLILSYLVAEDYAEAHRSVNSLIEYYPNSSEAINYKGIILQLEGENRKALELFDQAFELSDRKDVNALLNRGKSYLANGETNSAIADFRKLTVLAPSDPRGWHILGVTYFNEADWTQAIDAFQQSIVLDKNSYVDYNLMAMAYRFKGEHRDAIKLLKNSIQINPSFFSAHSNLGMVYLDISQPEEAVIHFEKAFQILDEASNVEAESTVDILGCQLLGVLHNENCQVNLLRRDEDFDSFNTYGDAYRGNLQKAKAQIRENLSVVYQALGNIEYRENKDHNKALALYQKSIKNWNENASALINRGSLYLDTNKFSLALKDLNKAINIGLENNLKLSQAYSIRASIYNQLSEYDKAIADADTAIKLWPQSGNANVWINRGIAFYEKKDYQLALKDFNVAVMLGPEIPIAHYGKGETLRQLQEYEDALESFDSAISINAEYDHGYHRRGLTYLDIGEQDKAIADLKKALEVTGDNQLKEQIQKDLDKVQ